MNKRIISFITGAILITGTVFPVSSFAVPGSSYNDSKTATKNTASITTKDTSWFDYLEPKKTYKISTESQLIGLASLVNEQQIEAWKPSKYEDFKGVTFVLTKDIKLTQKWKPMGIDDYVTFKGTFDGQGHTISGLDVDITGNNAGFFGYLSGTVKNLTLKGHVKTTGSNCGAFAGYIGEKGRLYNCISEVKVNAGAKTGGISGYNYAGEIYRCINKGTVSGTIKVGGITGENWSSVIKSANHGTVISKNRGVSTFGTGGVAGRSVSENAHIDQCYNKGEIRSHTEATGGIVGYTNARGSVISNSYNTGTVKVSSPAKAFGEIQPNKGYAGGIAGTVGTKGISVYNCYNAGSILNTDVSGGIIGLYHNESKLSEDKFIRNNHFVNVNVKYGIGQDSHGQSCNIARGTSVISTGSLRTEASNLGPYYSADSSGAYGSGGYPVLSWQDKVPESEKEYISQIPRSTQKEFENYLSKHSGADAVGSTVMMFFNHNEYASQKPGDFYDK